MTTALQQAAQALIYRWDTADWKSTKHTADYVNALRKALSDEKTQAANSRIASLYEELRKAIDEGSESMTHDDALKQIAYWQNKAQQVAVPAPMTDDEIRLLVDKADEGQEYLALAVVRAVEKHHGIGEKP